ncbi:hypothetical protein ACIBEK_00055 [Nocardia fusca]|uniref:hypothetical protein n=1 Tax=Nocardia fusca TaxID=941183 RepID=UPI0037A3A990
MPGTNSGGQRDRRAARMGEDPCSDCTQEQRQTERAARDAAAAAEQQLPDLTGSERQITWAMTLRAEALAVLNVTDHLDHEEPTDRDREARRSIADIRTVYLATTAAKAWIDHRAYQLDPARLARALATDEHKAELSGLASGGRGLQLTVRLALSRINRSSASES